jgi:hypothetical protein
MAICMTTAQVLLGASTAIRPEWFFLAVWIGWTTAHILMDITGYWLVRLFNRNKIIDRSNYPWV